MLRKDFIKSISILTGSTIVAPLFANNIISTQNNGKYKKGISYYMIQDDLSVLDKFKLVKDLGFDGIEINTPADIPLKELVDASNKTGIVIPSTVNKDHWGKPLSDPDSSVRQFTIDSVIKSLHETKELGGDTVLVVPGVVNEKVSYETAYNNALESIKKLIPHVEKTGVKIGLENVWNNFILSPVEARDFIDKINHPLIGWYFDLG